MPQFDPDSSLFILRGRSSSRAVWEAASPSWRGTVSTFLYSTVLVLGKSRTWGLVQSIKMLQWHPLTNVSISILCVQIVENKSSHLQFFHGFKYGCILACLLIIFAYWQVRQFSSSGSLFFDRMSRLSVHLCIQRCLCSMGKTAARDSTADKYAEVYCVWHKLLAGILNFYSMFTHLNTK